MRNAAFVALAFGAFPAHAAAYYVGEIGAKAMARGGADLVGPDDPMASWSNPAALTLAKGIQLDVDVNLVALESSFLRDCGGIPNGCAPPADLHRVYTGTDGSKQVYDVKANRPPPNASSGLPPPAEPGFLGLIGTRSFVDGRTPTVNTGPIQPIPRIMLSVNGDTFGVDGVALGAYVYAPNNGHYTFGADTPTRFSLIDRNLLEVYYGLAFGYRYGDVIAVGAGLQFVTAGLDQSVALSADQASGESPNGDIVIHVKGEQDFIPSGNFGVWSNPGKLLGLGDLEIGGSAQLGRTVKATGPVAIVSEGSDIQTFIKSGQVKLDVNGATATAEFKLAPFYRVGANYKGGDDAFKYDVEADFVYEQWSVYDHVFLATKGAKVSFGGGAPKELDPVVQPKDWNDSYSVRLGGSGAFLDGKVGVHAGAYYESSAIPSTTYDIELADGDKVGAGLGLFGKLFGATLTVGYSHVFIFDRTVGKESIVYDGSSGNSIELTPANAPPGQVGGADIRTRVAMGKYSAGFDMLDVALTVGIDELFGFGDAHKPAASQAK